MINAKIAILAAIKCVNMKKLSIILLLLMSVSLSAQNTFTPEKMWELHRVGSPAVSPNGELLLYTTRSYTIKDNTGSTVLHVYSLKENTTIILQQGARINPSIDTKTTFAQAPGDLRRVFG